MSRTIIIGLHPEYNYPGDFKKWGKENTKYASNFGACLISQSIAKITGGEFVSDFSDLPSLKNKYDQCVVALATHITSWRDMSYYTDIIKKLDMPTFAFSLGIQDYAKKVSDVKSLHPSLIEFLQEVSKRSKYIGVRGHYTASLLYRFGFENVVPIGCPTLFNPGDENLQVHKKEAFSAPLVVFHRTIAPHIQSFISNIDLLGQDFLDEAVFTNNFPDDTELKNIELKHFKNQDNWEHTLSAIKNNGIFPGSFNEWFKIIANHDFVLGPRLHGCISAIIQGVPSIMIARDLRVKEIAEYFEIPYLFRHEINKLSLEDLYKKADFQAFNELYPRRYNNFIQFLNENGVKHVLKTSLQTPKIEYTVKDIRISSSIIHSEINELAKELQQFKKESRSTWPYRIANKIKGRQG